MTGAGPLCPLCHVVPIAGLKVSRDIPGEGLLVQAAQAWLLWVTGWTVGGKAETAEHGLQEAAQEETGTWGMGRGGKCGKGPWKERWP